MRYLGPSVLVAMAFVAFMAAPAAAKEPASFESYLNEPHAMGTLAVSAGPDYIKLAWNGLTLGDQASHDIRELADGALSGEKDGRVDSKELNDALFALRALFESNFNKAANHHDLSGVVLIDRAEAQKVEVTKLTTKGLEGDVDQAAPVEVTLEILVSFPNVDDGKDVHTVRVDLGRYFLSPKEKDEDGDGHADAASPARDLTLTVGGAPGWTLDSASVQPACAAEDIRDGRMVFHGDDVDCFTGHDGVLLSFAITGKGTGKNFLPGFGLAPLVAGAALVLARRRFA